MDFKTSLKLTEKLKRLLMEAVLIQGISESTLPV
jgi:hypothetical protein